MEPDQNPKPKHFPWAVAIIAGATVIVTGFALIAYLRTTSGVKHTMDKGIDAMDRAVNKLSKAATNFLTGNITHTFRESLPSITSTQGDVLELAVSQSDETFTRADEKRAFWDQLYLGTTVAEIRVPVTYRYHLRLSETWRLATRSNVCIVLAPAIRPSLPPAVHLSKMEKKAESGWARFDKNDRLDELERSMSATLQQRAMDTTHLASVRESCRQSTAEFVRKWLMREDQWRSDRFTSIIVVFPDEQNIATDDELSRFNHDPTLKLRPN